MTGRCRTWRGLTLFEVVIAIALIALLLGTLLTFFWQTLAIRDQAAKNADRTQIAQQVLLRMAAELQAATGQDQVDFSDGSAATGACVCLLSGVGAGRSAGAAARLA